jgi:hypothetical protein
VVLAGAVTAVTKKGADPVGSPPPRTIHHQGEPASLSQGATKVVGRGESVNRDFKLLEVGAEEPTKTGPRQGSFTDSRPNDDKLIRERFEAVTYDS